jgi:hypothetical protein
MVLGDHFRPDVDEDGVLLLEEEDGGMASQADDT